MLARPVWQILRRAEKIEALTLLVAENMSASEIAARFEGATRNAIIGFCGRWGLVLPNGRPGPAPKTPAKQKPPRRARPPKPIGNRASVAVSLPEPDPATAVLFTDAIDLKLCKWPLWTNFSPAAKCCGAPRAGTGPYCEHHARRSLRPRLSLL